MEFTTLGGVQSRRSYPSLNHVSVAPLTPRFPIDDDPEPVDYFSPRGDAETAAGGAHTPPLTSYISSVSVPSTPSVLSHSRSASRVRHTRSKSGTRVTPLSDTNLHGAGVALPLNHHQAALHKKRPGSIHARRFAEGGHAGTSASDAEWMLRAGIALASSTREEKGQSWLSKRESSTSLVSEMPFDEAGSATHNHHRRTKSGASSTRKSRSGASTPAGYSRRSSRSRGGSRRSSRAGLLMTSMPNKATGSGGATSPETHSRGSGALVADFVDERIRAEMASLEQQQDLAVSDEEFEYWDGDEDSDSEYDFSSDEEPDAIDEADLQRLTRERGFGLGSWIDRLAEWTLFSTEEWPVPVSPATGPAARIGTAATSTTVTFEEPVVTSTGNEGDDPHDALSLVSADHEGDDEVDDADALSHADGESMVSIERPSVQGGWEDAGWLLRVMKRAIL